MVLDLSLPDISGFNLLERLSRDDAYAFPPVIIYTGRDLTPDEELRLRRHSKSIIIKGAKSPERLLDEVTLFLHQVVSDLPAEQRKMIEKSLSRDAALEGKRILVVEDDVRNVFALTSALEPRGALVQIARNGREALQALELSAQGGVPPIDLDDARDGRPDGHQGDQETSPVEEPARHRANGQGTDIASASARRTVRPRGVTAGWDWGWRW